MSDPSTLSIEQLQALGFQQYEHLAQAQQNLILIKNELANRQKPEAPKSPTKAL